MGKLLVKNKDLVVPGEVLVEGMDYLPSTGLFREGERIIANTIGLVSIDNRLVKLIPLTGFYMPKKNDVVIAISASGNSLNVINALQYAKDNGAKTIGFVGFDGGKMKDIVDVCIHIKTPNGWYGPVEDVHLILNHIISGYFNEKFRS